MSKIVPFLLVLLIAGVAWQVVATSSLRDDLRRLDDDATTLQSALGDLEGRMRTLDGRTPEPDLRVEIAAGEGDADTADGPRLVPRAADATVLARAVRDLQSRLSEQEARFEGMEEKVSAASQPRNRVPFKPPIRTIEDAQRRLDLSGPQRADIERLVEYAQRDLEDLRNLPNADGKTWKDVQASTTTTSDGGMTVVMTNMAEVMKYRSSTIPGSNETYGQAEQRIRKQAASDIRDVLSPEQQETWDGSSTHGLLGASSPSAFFQLSTGEAKVAR